MENKPPLISVILPVYNAGPFLKEAVDSILNQSYPHLELLIYNDGSTDQSSAILNQFKDPRIKLFEAEANRGYVYYLNRGLKESKGTYIARMDADDIALPTRIETQVQFMEQHTEFGLCGTWVKGIGDRQTLIKRPVKHEEICTHLLFYTTFIHPSVIFRRSVIEQNKLNYSEAHELSEDYELFCKMAKLTKLAILPKVLLKYRFHVNNVSVTHRRRQYEILYRIRIQQQEDYIGRSLDQWEQDFLSENIVLKRENIIRAKYYLQTLVQTYKQKSNLDSKQFQRFLERRFFHILLRNPNWGISYLTQIPWIFIIFPNLLLNGISYRYFGKIILKKGAQLIGYTLK